MNETEQASAWATRGADVRAIDLGVADESCMPHSGWTHFVDLVLRGVLPHVAAWSWSTAETTLDAVDGSAVRTGRSDGVHSALVELDGAWAYVHLGRGRVSATIGAADAEAIDAARAWLRERLPEAEPEDSTVFVTFWAHGSFGASRFERRIEVPAWPEVAGNYPRAVRAQLDPIVAGRPGNAGQLILWHGPPGTGKTHVVRSLAWEWRDWCDVHFVADPEEFFGRAEYMLGVLTDEDEEDDRWRLLALEDTGELLTADAKERTGQGLSRFLNVVDGVLGQGLRLLVLVTTNESLRALHPAVSRPGRCAAAVEFEPFAPDEASAWLAARGVEAEPEALTLAELYARAEGREIVREQAQRIGF